MTEFLAKGYCGLISWPRGSDDRVLGPGLLTTEFLTQGCDDRVLDPGLLTTDFVAQGY